MREKHTSEGNVQKLKQGIFDKSQEEQVGC